ncbi:uncharacterized protein METZ01_LOCUS503215, partial [marine metagenome]
MKIISPNLKYKKFVSILVLMSFISAGTVGKITGKIVDKSTGDGLAGANVVIDGTGLGASASEDGTYFIINVPAGSYSITASYIGYESVT